MFKYCNQYLSADNHSCFFFFRNDLDSQLGKLNSHLQSLVDTRQTALLLEQERDNFSKQLSMVRELEALGSAQTSHAFVQRYNVYKNELDNFNKIKVMMQTTLNELELLISTNLNLIKNPEVMQQNSEFNAIESDEVKMNETEFDIMHDMMIDNNWSNAYMQAKFTRHEMENAFIQCKRSALECRDLLIFYSGVMQFYPRSKFKSYRVLKYRQLFSNVLEAGHKSNDEKQVDARQNIECCGKYFEGMKVALTDLQESVAQAKTIFEEHKQQLVSRFKKYVGEVFKFVFEHDLEIERRFVCVLFQ